MRKPLIGLLIACVAGFVLMAPTAVDKCSEHSECRCSEWIKDVKFDVSNVENGIMIKITSDNPEGVKLIQEHAPKCVIECKLGTRKFDHKEGSAECKSETKKCKLEEGKCTLDNPDSCCKEKDASECKKTCDPEECKKTCEPEKCKKP